MYTIFFDERTITISDKNNNSNGLCIDYNDIENIKSFVEEFNANSLKHSLSIIHSSPDSVLDAICKSFKYIEAAGGFVVNKENKALFIYRLEKWDLPKGKREKKEGIEECALREVEEECGIDQLKILNQLPSTFHTYTAKGVFIVKQTFWYTMSYNGDQKGTPQREEGINQVVWVEKKEIEPLMGKTYGSIKEVISNALKTPLMK